MADEPEFITRLREEHEQLIDKLFKLTSFRASDGIERLTERHRALLTEQFNLMGAYAEVLARRLEDLTQ